MALQKKFYMFKNLQFLFIPNKRSDIYTRRKNLARNGMAQVNRTLTPQGTTHILVDQNVVKREPYLIKLLRQEGFTAPLLKEIKIVTQDWLVDSIEESKLQDTKPYEIKLEPEFFDKAKSPTFLKEKQSLEFPDPLGKEKIVVPDAKILSDGNGLLKIGVEAQSNDESVRTPEVQITKSPRKFKKVDLLENSLRFEAEFNNPNKKSIEILSRLADQMLMQGLDFKAKAYRSAIEALKKQSAYITTAKAAQRIPGIGPSIAEKIQQISSGGGLAQLDDTEASEEVKILKMFTQIHGVGPGFAKRWINEGMRTLKDISERSDLTKPQRLGLKYYDDWVEKIPRAECTAHCNYLNKVLGEIDPEVQLTIGGSYRRGAQECGDVDFIITKPEAKMPELTEILEKLKIQLEKSGYLRCVLTRPSTKLYTGCSLLPKDNEEVTGVRTLGKCRRVDFLLVPWQEIGAALIYFTGNDHFNRKIRLRAARMNLVLNENGLFKRITYLQGKNVKDRDMLIESFSERKIFKFLGVAYEEPEARNIGSDDSLLSVRPEEIDVGSLEQQARGYTVTKASRLHNLEGVDTGNSTEGSIKRPKNN